MKELSLSWDELMNMNWGVVLRIMADLPRQVKKEDLEQEIFPETLDNSDQLKMFFERANRNAKKL